MAYFPVFVELKDQNVWIIGGGSVAYRKVQKLLPYGAKITVIASRIERKLDEISGIMKKKQEFKCSMLKEAEEIPALVIAATNDENLNTEIAVLCKEKRIPVNVADSLEKCSFVFPALVKKGKLSAGICTSGVSPTASAYFKECLKEALPENLDVILDWMEEKRKETKEIITDQEKRMSFQRKLFHDCIKRERPLTEKEWVQYQKQTLAGSVSLVGAGCGKADLITVRGLRLLQQCEAVVYDDLIDMELLDCVPETAEKIYMGKRFGTHSAPQEEINAKLIELAKTGLKVVRLKGGDPYLFGRGGEEMQALLQAGIPCQEVPGIPSAIGILAEAGIPVTHRGISRGLHIITAHTSDTEDGLPEDFDALAELSGTLVFLMGLRQLPRIAERLLKAGKSGDTPAAVISGGNAPHPAKVRAKLSEIAAAAEEADIVSPAVIVIGGVAELDFHI